MDDLMLPLPGLSPVSGKRLDVRFDGGLLSSDGGILLLREVEQRLGVADRLAACIKDPRAPEHITHRRHRSDHQHDACRRERRCHCYLLR